MEAEKLALLVSELGVGCTNAPPHMGSAYTTIAADAIARFQVNLSISTLIDFSLNYVTLVQFQKCWCFNCLFSPIST